MKFVIKVSLFSSGQVDSCFGDSGGPVGIEVKISPTYPGTRYIQLGVISWGRGYVATIFCLRVESLMLLMIILVIKVQTSHAPGIKELSAFNLDCFTEICITTGKLTTKK